ncbi:hypothetical protein DND67_27530 [Pseudomonas syringae pv. pisi]|nr:hypothetical protein DND67_27530 [Pseudomonas syringae pv. pisi]
MKVNVTNFCLHPCFRFVVCHIFACPDRGSCWLPVRSCLAALRILSSLTAIGRFAESVGIRTFQVEV